MPLYVRNSALAWKDVPQTDGKLYVQVGGLGWKKVKTLYVRRVHPNTLALEWKKVGNYAAPGPPVGYEAHQDGTPSGAPEMFRVYAHLHAGLPADATTFYAKFQRSAQGTGPWEDLIQGYVTDSVGGPLYSTYSYSAAAPADHARAVVMLANTAGLTAEYTTNSFAVTEVAPFP